MTERIPQSPPIIKPVPDQIQRPLWSVMIPAYNCSRYLTDTIRSVLQQDPGAEWMQIEVVDDCSTDADVEALVQQIGHGRVGFYRQPKNVGSLRNFETCLNRSTGQYIHLLHGDDQVKPGFYAEIKQLFILYPEAGAAFTGFNFVDGETKRLYDNPELLDEPGILYNWLIKIASAQLVQVPAMVVKRYVYEKLGSFYAVHYGEDWEMWARIAANYPVAHSPKKLALYRVHENNITSRYFLSGQSMTDAMTVINIIQNYLPQEERARAKKAAKKHIAHYFAQSADKIYHQFGKPDIAVQQSKRALRMHLSFTTLFYFIKMQFKKVIRYKRSHEQVVTPAD